MKEVLQAPEFNLMRDLDILPRKSGEEPDDPYTTANTLLELEFDGKDVYEELLKLSVGDYYETVPDNKWEDAPPFYAFIRNIGGRDVYIKVKVRTQRRKSVFCVSFHFARYPVGRLPYGR